MLWSDLQPALGISIGAAVTGVVGVALACIKNNHDLRSLRLEKELSLFHEAINRFDAAGSLVNEAAQAAALMDRGCSISGVVETLCKASNEVISASTQCYMVGRSELGVLMGEYADLLNRMRDAYKEKGLNVDEAFVECNTALRLSVRKQVIERLRGDFTSMFYTQRFLK